MVLKVLRPLHFNYLSYELFFGKKYCQTPKKKGKKSQLWCFTDESGFEIFCQTQKKKSASFKNIHCMGDLIHYSKLSMLYSSRASDLRMYISHPSGYRD